MPRTVIVLSDTHLGTPQADPSGLADFLRSLVSPASRLRVVLNGDIVDLWRATDEECATAGAPVFEALRDLTSNGATVDWVLGNHDHHLLRALEHGGSPVLDALPDGVRFHHPFRRLVQGGRVFLVTHGDLYDFLHVPLEEMGPLSWVLSPPDVYGFYDWVYGLDKELVAAFDREGTRGLLMAWIAETWREVWEALRGSTAMPAADASVASAAATAMSQALPADPADFVRALARLPLSEVWDRTDDALSWRRMRYVSPHPTRVSRRRFAGRHEVVTGHFHDARQHVGEDWAVTDDGAWWSGPGEGGTFVEIVDGVSTLKRWPGP
jgi:UDP-2,3-diacylglucosamine pyrophosphatase LpxH